MTKHIQASSSSKKQKILDKSANKIKKITKSKKTKKRSADNNSSQLNGKSKKRKRKQNDILNLKNEDSSNTLKKKSKSKISKEESNDKISSEENLSAPVNIDSNSFENFKIPEPIINNLRKHNIVNLFEIQAKSFNSVYEGFDLVGRAHTGQGKTLAFVLPIISKLENDIKNNNFSTKRFRQHPSVLVLCPVRELAQQVAKVFEQTTNNLSVLCIYGGTPYASQFSALRNGVDIVVGTCGRIKDHIERKSLKLDKIRFMVLDECDEMLNVGFADDVELIMSSLKSDFALSENEENNSSALAESKQKHQTLLFSATLPKQVHQLSSKYLRKDKITIDLVGNKRQQAVESVKHMVICCHYGERNFVLADILDLYLEPESRVIIFADRKKDCNDLAQNSLIKYECQVLHGDIAQDQRQTTIQGFSDGRFPVLVATDVAARGIDIPGVDLVINLEPPSDVETYIHRSGRTGRAGKTGCSILFYTPRQVELVNLIERRSSISFKRIGAPQPCQVQEAQVRRSLQLINSMSDNSLNNWIEHARQLLKKQKILLNGDLSLDSSKHDSLTKLIASFLAAMNSKNSDSSQNIYENFGRSMLCGTPNTSTIFVQFDCSSNYSNGLNSGCVWRSCKSVIGDEAANNIRHLTLAKDGKSAVFDIDSKYLNTNNSENIIQYLSMSPNQNSQPLRNLVLKHCKELPELASFDLYSNRTKNSTNVSSNNSQNENNYKKKFNRFNSNGFGRNRRNSFNNRSHNFSLRK